MNVPRKRTEAGVSVNQSLCANCATYEISTIIISRIGVLDAMDVMFASTQQSSLTTDGCGAVEMK